jgi:hypothetical protein
VPLHIRKIATNRARSPKTPSRPRTKFPAKTEVGILRGFSSLLIPVE